MLLNSSDLSPQRRSLKVKAQLHNDVGYYQKL